MESCRNVHSPHKYFYMSPQFTQVFLDSHNLGPQPLCQSQESKHEYVGGHHSSPEKPTILNYSSILTLPDEKNNIFENNTPCLIQYQRPRSQDTQDTQDTRSSRAKSWTCQNPATTSGVEPRHPNREYTHTPTPPHTTPRPQHPHTTLYQKSTKNIQNV